MGNQSSQLVQEDPDNIWVQSNAPQPPPQSSPSPQSSNYTERQVPDSISLRDSEYERSQRKKERREKRRAEKRKKKSLKTRSLIDSTPPSATTASDFAPTSHTNLSASTTPAVESARRKKRSSPYVLITRPPPKIYDNMDRTSGAAPTAQMYNKTSEGDMSKLQGLASLAGQMSQYPQSNLEAVLDPRLNGYERAEQNISQQSPTFGIVNGGLDQLIQATAGDGLGHTEVDAFPGQASATKSKTKRSRKKANQQTEVGEDELIGQGDATVEDAVPSRKKIGKRKRGDNLDGGQEQNEVPASTEKPRKRKKKDIKAGPNGEPPPEQELPSAGPLVPYEIDRVERFIEQYRVENNLADQDINNMVQNKSRERDVVLDAFWGQVYEQLPHRDPRSIRLSTRRRHHNYVNRGTWGADDDDLLRKLFKEKPNGWTYIGETMARMPDDCKDRWQNYLSCGEARKVGEWTEKEEIELAMAVEDCKRKVRNEAKDKAKKEGRAFRDDRDWGALISFKVVSEKLGRSRSGLQCRQHWKVMQRREAEEERKRENGDDEMTKAAKKQKLWRQKQAEENFKHMLPGDKVALLDQIQKSETRSEEKIPWRMLTAELPDTKWSTMDRKIAWDQIKLLIEQRETLQEHVAALKQYFEDTYGEEGLAEFYEGPVKGANEKAKREARKAQAHEDRERSKVPGTSSINGDDDMATQDDSGIGSHQASLANSARPSRKYKSSEVITASDHEADAEGDADNDDQNETGNDDDDTADDSDGRRFSNVLDHVEDSMMQHPYHHARVADMTGAGVEWRTSSETAKAMAAAGLESVDRGYNDGGLTYDRDDSMDVERG